MTTPTRKEDKPTYQELVEANKKLCEISEEAIEIAKESVKEVATFASWVQNVWFVIAMLINTIWALASTITLIAS